MSRSRRHTPITGNTIAKSDKPGKRADSRRLRRRGAVALAQSGDGDTIPHDRAIRNPWNWPKDGKGWHGSSAGLDRIMRK